jgi:hypothetical protein
MSNDAVGATASGRREDGLTERRKRERGQNPDRQKGRPGETAGDRQGPPCSSRKVAKSPSACPKLFQTSRLRLAYTVCQREELANSPVGASRQEKRRQAPRRCRGLAEWWASTRHGPLPRCRAWQGEHQRHATGASQPEVGCPCHFTPARSESRNQSLSSFSFSNFSGIFHR